MAEDREDVVTMGRGDSLKLLRGTRSPSVAELAPQQGVRPVESVDDMQADLWDSDEELEEFLANVLGTPPTGDQGQEHEVPEKRRLPINRGSVSAADSDLLQSARQGVLGAIRGRLARLRADEKCHAKPLGKPRSVLALHLAMTGLVVLGAGGCGWDVTWGDLPKAELVDAVSRNLVDVRDGSEINAGRLTIRSKAKKTFEITILPGTLFAAKSGGASRTVVAVEQRVLTLSPGEESRLDGVDEEFLRVTCLKKSLDVRGQEVIVRRERGDLVTLVSSSEFTRLEPNVQQWAIWTITGCEKGDTELTDWEFGQIRQVFAQLGIRTDRYVALRRPMEVELVDAISRKLVDVRATGNGLDEVDLTIRSRVGQLVIKVPSGTLFDAKSRGVQTMVLKQQLKFSLLPGGELQETLSVACADMGLEPPGPMDRFVVERRQPGDLTTLVSSSEFQKLTQDSALQQFAVWTITDNPARNRYAEILLPSNSISPSSEDLEQIRRLFVKVGISTDRYRALR